MRYLLLFMLFVTSHGRQYFSQEPEDVTVSGGETLVLPCEVTNRRGRCQWTRDGFGLGVDSSLPGFPRYSMPDDQGGAACDLTITPVLPTDEAVYQCQVGAVAGDQAIVSRSAQVRVLAMPEQPYISQAMERDVFEVVEGSHIVLDCVSQGGRPAAHITWYRDDTEVTANIKENIMREKGGNTFRTHSTISFIPERNMKIKCGSSSEQFLTKFSEELEIRMRYPPKLDISVSKDKIREGDKFSVVCDSKAYPENVAYKWFFNGVEIKGEDGATLDIEDISRKHHQSSIKCSVANEIGRTEVATELSVFFPPKILQHPSSVTARRGENVTFHCVAESNPSPTYLWTRHRHDTLESVSQNFTVIASEFTEKTYVCKVFADGHKIVSSLPATLVLLRRPTIYTDMIRMAKVGGSLVLSCLVDSNANSTAMLWTRNNDPVDMETGKYRVTKTSNGRKHTSVLVIDHMESSDFGNYGCFAVNEVGKDYARIVVKRISETSILGTGIGIALILALILGVGIFIWCKCRQKCLGFNSVASEDNGKMPMKGFM